MKINPVKQFVRDNISKFERDWSTRPSKTFNLYDKNGSYRGEYNFTPIYSNVPVGMKTSMSTTRIMSDNLRREIEEIVYIDKDFVNIYNPNSEFILKTEKFPTEITTTTTILDFINDKFKTIRIVSKLKNKLQRMDKSNPNFMYSDNYVVYEPLKEKPKYEQSVEMVREGSISETKKNNVLIEKETYYRNSKLGCLHQIPYRFW